MMLISCYREFKFIELFSPELAAQSRGPAWWCGKEWVRSGCGAHEGCTALHCLGPSRVITPILASPGGLSGEKGSLGICIRDPDDSRVCAKSSSLSIDPTNTSSFGDYAIFLETVHRDYDRTEKMYERAIAADPDHVYSLRNYAVFLETVRRDYDRADTMYGWAIAADPSNADILGVYAVFLKNVRCDYGRAERMYDRAIQSDPNNAHNLGYYADFLKNVRHDYDRAEEMYRRTIDKTPPILAPFATTPTFYGWFGMITIGRRKYTGGPLMPIPIENDELDVLHPRQNLTRQLDSSRPVNSFREYHIFLII